MLMLRMCGMWSPQLLIDTYIHTVSGQSSNTTNIKLIQILNFFLTDRQIDVCRLFVLFFVRLWCYEMCSLCYCHEALLLLKVTEINLRLKIIHINPMSYGYCYILECDSMYSSIKTPNFRKHLLSPSSGHGSKAQLKGRVPMPIDPNAAECLWWRCI